MAQMVTEIGNRLVEHTNRKDVNNYQFYVIDRVRGCAMSIMHKIAIDESLIEKMKRLNIDSYEGITLEDKIAAVLSMRLVT